MANSGKKIMSERSKHVAVWLLPLLTCSLLGDVLSAAEEPAPQLRYRWQAGQTYVYRVSAEIDQGDYLDILSGTPSYTVAKVEPDGIILTFRGSLQDRKQAKPGKRIIFRPQRVSPYSPFTGIGSSRASELTVNDRGEILSMKGSSQLPYVLGNLSQLMLIPLPDKAERTWQVTRDTGISLAESRPLRGPMNRSNDEKVLKAAHETRYAIEKVTDATVVLSKRSELKTAETVDGKPRYEIIGEGTLELDRKTGLPVKMEFQQKLMVRDEKGAEETPIKLSIQLLDEAERAKLAATPEGTRLFPNEPLSEDLQAQALADLKSGEKLRSLRALTLLQGKDPKKPNQEMAQALADLMAGGDDASTRVAASRALIRWATDDTVPALVKALDAENAVVRHNALDALGRRPAEAAARPVAQRLTTQVDRFKATQVLQGMGPGAEPAVLALAESQEWQVRSEVCKILKVIGTQKSVPALTALQNDQHPLVKRQAREALEAINGRK
jgi:hypothetical protein